MELNEVFTDAQFEAHLHSAMAEMHTFDPVAYGFTPARGFSAMIEFPTMPEERPLCWIGYWASEAEAALGLDPAWIVATCADADVYDVKLSLGLRPSPSAPLRADARAAMIACEGLPGAEVSTVNRSPAGRYYSVHRGEGIAVVTAGREAPISTLLRPIDAAGISSLIENWGRMARGLRAHHA